MGGLLVWLCGCWVLPVSLAYRLRGTDFLPVAEPVIAVFCASAVQTRWTTSGRLSRRRGSDLADRQANFRRQQAQRCAFDHLTKLRVVTQLARLIQLQHLLFQQRLDEVAEQALVKKLRCIQAVQDRQPLCHYRAEIFQRFRGQGVLSGVEQQGNRHVEALQRLQYRARQQGQHDELLRARWWLDKGGTLALQQALPDKRFQPLVDHRTDFVHRPANEQLCLQVGIQRLDVLVNNAGILISGPFESNPLARHHAVVDVNLKGLLNGCYLAKPYLAATPQARAINLSSTAALYGQASLATYSTTKCAVRGLTEALNVEWQADGIRVMDIMPMFVQTDMLTAINARSMDRLGARLTADDVARTIWAAAAYRGGFGKVHWPVGSLATWLMRLTRLAPDRLNRYIARRVAA